MALGGFYRYGWDYQMFRFIRPLWLPNSVATGFGITRRLAQHPSAITTMGAIFRADTAAEGAGPWWNTRAVSYLGEHLRDGDRVFEWGSGRSTDWLVSRGALVTSIEHDYEWVEKVTERCPEADIRAIPGSGIGTTEDQQLKIQGGARLFFDDYIAAINEFADSSFNIVIVDGMCRPECLRAALPKVRPGGLIIVDDTDKWVFRRVKKSLPEWKTVSRAALSPHGISVKQRSSIDQLVRFIDIIRCNALIKHELASTYHDYRPNSLEGDFWLQVVRDLLASTFLMS